MAEKKMTFEEAKQKWLKEVVKGRSWTEMINSGDKEQDQIGEELLNDPEWIKFWEENTKR